MKLLACRALYVVLFVPLACHKSVGPTPAGSAAPATSAALGAGSAGASSLAVLDGFEGEIAVTAKGKLGGKRSTTPTNFVLQVKDGKFRVDLPEGSAETQTVGKAFALVAPAEKKLYLVLESKKQVILVDFDKFANQAKALSQAHPQGGAPSSAPANVVKTGQTDVVAGYSCELWHIVQQKSVGDLCIADQGTSWFHIPLSGVPAEFAWANEITDGKHFPLRFVASDNGVEEGRIEVTNIQQKALPAVAFAIPSGYGTIDLEQMLGAMMGGMGALVPPGALPSGFAPGMLQPELHAGPRGPKKPH